ncbi:carboxypeptidase Y inhibitor [Vermiconidia calcicola]|uniref:Carboxypeptidase Y inhibitor n=1 Tax=Vermiconidia calcicola TaxID=1690605 RepID=A0ACC3MV76_9PEZI|nr:carboxypeptidase Y inhibitor [Vermiconidia calcicola]
MAAFLSFIVCVFFVASGLFALNAQQQFKDGDLDLLYELKKAEIIPTVFDEFKPQVSISVQWANASAEYGNTINPSRTQKEPKIKLIDSTPSFWSDGKKPQLTVALTDPDAPSRDNPEWSEICHWLTTDVDLRKPDHDDDDDEEDLISKAIRMLNSDVMPYKPPGPPPKTGKHRYVFVALMPKNGTTDSLHLEKPGDRQHWGYKHERNGVRMWAEDMGLEVIGANFIYEQNDEQ